MHGSRTGTLLVLALHASHFKEQQRFLERLGRILSLGLEQEGRKRVGNLRRTSVTRRVTLDQGGNSNYTTGA